MAADAKARAPSLPATIGVPKRAGIQYTERKCWDTSLLQNELGFQCAQHVEGVIPWHVEDVTHIRYLDGALRCGLRKLMGDDGVPVRDRGPPLARKYAMASSV